MASTTVITYAYDPLSRLTSANSSGAYTTTFGYAYDAVGNRTVQTRTITSTQVITYQYDPANRLSNAGGVTYTWDNNGNLINDGSSLYRYDRANRLISTTLGGTTSLFNYNGDGVRLKQIIAGVPTTYTQDLAAPLPVVLQAQTGTATTQYLYGLGTRPLAQYGGAWEYLLPDALGSVTQIANTSGYVIRTQDYEPYGSPLNSSGNGQSVYGFTGEERDQSGLVFLRARYMQPTLGLFLTEDTMPGIASLPLSVHLYLYAWANPVSRIDPSGLQQPPPKCDFGDICSSGPTGPYTSETPPLPTDLQDPLSNEQWHIAKREASNFQIPAELVAGTVAVEIVHDTDSLDPLLDTFLLKSFLITLYCPSSDSLSNKGFAAAWLTWYNEHGLSGHSGLGPGPGVANIHIQTAIAAEDWFATQYPDTNLSQLLSKPSNIYIRLAALLTDEGNIRYTAGVLRQLADQRTDRYEPHLYEIPPKTNPANLTDLDMQMIYQGFRGSIAGYYGSIDKWRASTDPQDFGSQIAPYLPYYRDKSNR